MPANTVNRGYPYSLPGDPADVPAALQALAEAIDADVCALQNGFTARPVARFRGTGTFASITSAFPVNSPPNIFTARVPFDTVDFNTANVTMADQGIGNRLIYPEDPGFYFALATVYVPVNTVAGTTVTFMGLQIRRADITNPTLGASSRLGGVSSNFPVDADDRNVRVQALGLGAYMNGTTDAFSIEWRVDTTPDTASYVINERTFTLLKMTS
jgi:hypothetical protein